MDHDVEIDPYFSFSEFLDIIMGMTEEEYLNLSPIGQQDINDKYNSFA